MTATATYTDTGHLTITIDGVEMTVGTFDADGGEWIAPVDALLAKAGYRRTGDWGGDNAPIEPLVTSETVRHGGPQRVLYSEDGLMRADWEPIRPRQQGQFCLWYRYDEADPEWHCTNSWTMAHGPDEADYVRQASWEMTRFHRPHRVDRSIRMGRGPGYISWDARRPGEITIEWGDDGRGAPDPVRLTLDQARAAADYLVAGPARERRWFGAGDIAFLASTVYDGLAAWPGGGWKLHISRGEWAAVLRQGADAMESISEVPA